MFKKFFINCFLAVLCATILPIPTSLSAMEKDEKAQELSKLAMAKLAEARKKHRQSAANQLMELDNEANITDACHICKEALNKYPAILLHEANGSKQSNEKIPHKYHAHCLWNWYKSTHSHTSPVTNLNENCKSKKRIKLGCPLCGNNEFDVEVGDLCSKYLSYLSGLTLQERLRDLQFLPESIVNQTLEELVKMEPEKRTALIDADGIRCIQEAVFEMLLFQDSDNVETTINAALEIVGEGTLSRDFLVEISYYTEQNTYVTHFKRSFESNEPVSYLELQFSDNRPSDVDNNTANIRQAVLQYASRAELYRFSASRLSDELCIEYYDKMLAMETPSNHQKNKFINNCYDLLPTKEQLTRFDATYPILSSKKRADTLLRLKNDLMQERGATEMTDMVCKLVSSAEALPGTKISELREAYADQLLPQDRFALFERVVSDYTETIGSKYASYISQVCCALSQQEREPYLNFIAQFILARNDNGDAHKKIFGAFRDTQTFDGFNSFNRLYSLILENIAPGNDGDAKYRTFYQMLPRDNVPLDLMVNIINNTLDKASSFDFRNMLLRDGLQCAAGTYTFSILKHYLRLDQKEKAALREFVGKLLTLDNIHKRFGFFIQNWHKLPKNQILGGLQAGAVALDSISTIREHIVAWVPMATLAEKIEAFHFLAAFDDLVTYNYRTLLRTCNPTDHPAFKEACQKTALEAFVRMASKNKNQDPLSLCILIHCLSETDKVEDHRAILKGSLWAQASLHPLSTYAVLLSTDPDEVVWDVIETHVKRHPLEAKFDLLKLAWVQHPQRRNLSYNRILASCNPTEQKAFKNMVASHPCFAPEQKLVTELLGNKNENIEIKK